MSKLYRNMIYLYYLFLLVKEYNIQINSFNVIFTLGNVVFEGSVIKLFLYLSEKYFLN